MWCKAVQAWLNAVTDWHTAHLVEQLVRSSALNLLEVKPHGGRQTARVEALKGSKKRRGAVTFQPSFVSRHVLSFSSSDPPPHTDLHQKLAAERVRREPHAAFVDAGVRHNGAAVEGRRAVGVHGGGRLAQGQRQRLQRNFALWVPRRKRKWR